LGLPSGLFPSGLPTKTLYTSLLSPIRATYSANLIILYLIIRIIFGEQYRSKSSSLRSFLYFPVTSSLLGPNILLSTLFPNTLSLHSSTNVNDQVSHPYKATGKIIVLYILIFIFFIANWKTKTSAPLWTATLRRLQTANIRSSQLYFNTAIPDRFYVHDSPNACPWLQLTLQTQSILQVPPSLIFDNSTFIPNIVFMCSV